MKNSKHEEHDKPIIAQCKRFNTPIPDAILNRRKNKPQLGMGLEFFYKSFFVLCTERVFNEVVLGIAWSKIQEYADYYGMDFEESERFHVYISGMDEAYCKQMREDAKNKK